MIHVVESFGLFDFMLTYHENRIQCYPSRNMRPIKFYIDYKVHLIIKAIDAVSFGI